MMNEDHVQFLTRKSLRIATTILIVVLLAAGGSAYIERERILREVNPPIVSVYSSVVFKKQVTEGYRRVVFLSSSGRPVTHITLINDSDPEMMQCTQENNWVDIPASWRSFKAEIEDKPINRRFQLSTDDQIQFFVISSDLLG